MAAGPTGTHSQDAAPEINRRIREVLQRCRRILRLRCWARFAFATLLLSCLFILLLAIATLDGVPWSPYFDGALIVLFLAGEAYAGWTWLISPRRRSITLEQVALFIDEHHPELENRIVSAAEFSSGEVEGASAWIVERFLEETKPMVREISFSDLVDSATAAKSALFAFTTLVLSIGVLLVFSGLWLPSLSFVLPDRFVDFAAPPFTVEPGDIRVRRGDNQMIWLKTRDTGRKAAIRWRLAGTSWNGGGMEASTSEKVYYHQFTNVQTDIQYQVQFGRRRSQTFELRAWTPPEIDTIDLTYHYPDYLGYESREVPNGGNITAIEGTRVELAVWVNKKLNSAEMVLEGSDRLPLVESGESLWTTQITLAKNDTYHIELVDFEDAPSEYDPEYDIVVQRDKPPEIRIDFPRGDSEVTMLEEIPFDFSVSDDFGYEDFGIQYEIAGKEPVRIALNTRSHELVGEGAPAPHASTLSAEGHHQIMLEDLALEVGDFITWTVWANDAKPDRSAYATLGDPFFLEIRPFKRRYEESVSNAQGRGGGQQGDSPIVVQKDIIIATWNLRRDAPELESGEFDERRTVILDTQDGLIGELAASGGLLSQPRPEMIRLKEAMAGSIEALQRAELPEPTAALSEATVQQQQALRMLLKLMPEQLSIRRSRSSGSGGGQKERPDISALEMDRNRNFYEDENLTQEEQEAAEQVLSKIKELARRQQIANEEIARLISELQNASTEEEREELRRRLERLEEELRRNLESLDEVKNDLASGELANERAQKALEALQQAREQMNRSLEQLQQQRLQQARSAGARAGEALGDLEQMLQQFSGAVAAERMRKLLDRMEQLTEKQRGIQEGAEKMQALNESPVLDSQENMEEEQGRLLAEKESLADEFIDFMGEAADLADRAARTQELMARELGDWLRETSREGVLEDIEESRKFVRFGAWDSAVRQEEAIMQKLDEAAEKLQGVAQNIVEDDLEGMQKALEHLENLLGPEEAGESPSGQQVAASAPGDEPTDAPGEGQQDAQGQPTEGPGESQQEAQSQTPGAQPNSGQARQGGGSREAQRSAASTSGGGAYDWNAPMDMREFAVSGYQQWLEELRDAEALLPENTPWRGRVVGIREEVETMRRIWRERNLAPKYDLFLKVVARPLEQAAEEIQREIDRRLNEKEFVLLDQGDIPQKYKERVANYFKNLSESEESGAAQLPESTGAGG